MAEVVLQSLSDSFRKVASIADGWISKSPQVILPEKDQNRLTGCYRTKEGLLLELAWEQGRFFSKGFYESELSLIDSTTLFDINDAEALISFSKLQDEGYTYLTITHPLRLTITAVRT